MVIGSRLLVCLCSLGYIQAQSVDPIPQFNFNGFSSASAIHPVGSARIGTVLRLTPARPDECGTAWYAKQLRVDWGFETTFQFRITNPGGAGGGADGLAFVLQDASVTAKGTAGASGCFAVGTMSRYGGQYAIPRSVAIFFDTYKNRPGEDPCGDNPSNNYIEICSTESSKIRSRRVAIGTGLRANLKDGALHTAKIKYDANRRVLSVFLDGFPVSGLEAAPLDLSTAINAAGGSFVGFTASTGAGWENHDILNWHFLMPRVTSALKFDPIPDAPAKLIYCVPGRKLCTPERETVVESGRSHYYIILPANAEVSVPNPTNREVVLSKKVGRVCWDLEIDDPEVGCNGPEGNGLRAYKDSQTGFVKPDMMAGALASRTVGGRTVFFVNGRAKNRSATGFRGQEGSFGFEVDLVQAGHNGVSSAGGRAQPKREMPPTSFPHACAATDNGQWYTFDVPRCGAGHN